MYKIKLLTVCVALTNAISLNDHGAAYAKPIDVKDQNMTPVVPGSSKAASDTQDNTNNITLRAKRESRREERRKKRESERNSADAQKQIDDQNAANKEKKGPAEKEKAVSENEAGAEKANKPETNAAQVYEYEDGDGNWIDVDVDFSSELQEFLRRHTKPHK